MNKHTTPKVADELAAMDEINKNLRIWNELGRTDPAHTKGFKRAGGFSGTAVKPMWVVQRLTEHFGPCGEGWGIGEPRFEVVPAGGNEMLVYCTVSAWHGKPANILWGVGGDKVVTSRQNGPFCDDEAFKKAFTDAVNNAFKFIGVAADIHMGRFDDNKYVAQVQAEFHPPEKKEPEPGERREGDMSNSALRGMMKTLVHNLNGVGSVRDLDELLELDDVKAAIEQCQRRMPNWWETGEGLPAEFTPLKKRIEETRRGLAALEEENA